MRDGETGERFQKQKGISLSNKRYMKVSFYLGMNDIASHIRRYGVLMITFAISFVLITIPLNTLNTMTSEEMLYKFMINPKSTIHVRSIEKSGEEKYVNIMDLTNGVERVKTELEAKGYRNLKMTAAPVYFLTYSSVEKNKKQNIMSIQLVGDEIDYAQYQKGEAPVLENEIAFSKTIMDQNNWGIGDSVYVKIGGQEKKMIITGTYTDYMQLGQSVRLNSKTVLKDEVMFDYWDIMISMDTRLEENELKETLEKQFPNYEWMTGQELVNQNVGGIQDMLNEVLFPMTAMLCAVIMLITLLMEKLFIVREKGEIAMLKSIGFKYRNIRSWQITRMIFVALTSMIVAIPLSLLSNQFMLKPIFAIMGADVTIQVEPWSVYFIYPGMLLLGIIIATVFATRDVKKITIRECNQVE
ncbi:MAG: ABC transporter permease [Firmicutes bacterium]|nr:ABC transporter permease [Bacillota bacterium]